MGGGGSGVPEVVSWKPLDPNEPPMVRPSLALKYMEPGKFATLQPMHDGYELDGSQQPRTSSAITDLPDAGKQVRDSIELWRYTQSQLAYTPLYPIPERGHVRELLQSLTRVRDVVFNPYSRTRFCEIGPYDISAMVVQVTGEEAKVPCSNCKKGKGPFAGCYVMPVEAPSDLRRSIWGCANCLYNSNQCRCDLNKQSLEEFPRPKRGRPRLTTPGSSNSRPVINIEKKRPMKRRQSNLSNAVATSGATTGTDLRFASPPHTRSAKKKAKGTSICGSKRDPSHGVDGTVAINPAQMLELETWEVAPGRIGDEGSDVTKNFAFSNAYLAQNHAVQIGRDIAFQVVTIKPGTTYSWGSSAKRLRLCSLASGKLQIKMHGKEFTMGPNGMVRIKP
ncbi:uncharacterized protein F4822DRAFT_234411 [Hypoxylon trugodes]|uniref:uncharacterized protein n=1 Tax=Hypoxylon trugodes TaxID=326681 RepID=UPI00218DBB10|nr:uncharacterized protein F4822DRAFT_234411 [Hypoxylon trugodes]KAI1390376.1 hypothetical protein F4822DRAFT_234411 [Hypoxylon trugodes]